MVLLFGLALHLGGMSDDPNGKAPNDIGKCVDR